MLRRGSGQTDEHHIVGLADVVQLLNDDSITLFAAREAIVGAITCCAVAILFL